MSFYVILFFLSSNIMGHFILFLYLFSSLKYCNLARNERHFNIVKMIDTAYYVLSRIQLVGMEKCLQF